MKIKQRNEKQPERTRTRPIRTESQARGRGRFVKRDSSAGGGQPEAGLHLTTDTSRRSFMLSVWRMDDELNICPKTFRLFIPRSRILPAGSRVSQSGGIGRTRFFNWLLRVESYVFSQQEEEAATAAAVEEEIVEMVMVKEEEEEAKEEAAQVRYWGWRRRRGRRRLPKFLSRE